MEILQYIIGAIILILAVVLIVLISMQQGKRKGLENVISGHTASVGDAHIVTEGKADVQLVDPLPLGSKSRLHALGLVDILYQTVKNAVGDHHAGVGGRGILTGQHFRLFHGHNTEDAI